MPANENILDIKQSEELTERNGEKNAGSDL